MQTLHTPISVTVEIKQSKFITHLVPYALFETTLSSLKREHPKARHFVTAFRYRNEHGQIVEGGSDDGEPKGTSGKPSLAVLAGQDLIDIAVITVRYFGGTKLGTGGLVRAYTQAVNDAVASADLVPFIPQVGTVFTCGYGDVSKVEYLLRECGIMDAEKSFGVSEVRWSVSSGREAIEAFFMRAGRRIEKR